MAGGNSHQRAVEKAARARLEDRNTKTLHTTPDQISHDSAMARTPVFPLLRHFKVTLVNEVGEFMTSQIIWGVIVLTLVSIAYTAIHLGSSWGNILENVFALLCSTVWVVFLFALVVIFQTTRVLWKESGRTLSFRIKLLSICVLLMTGCVLSGSFLAVFAYRTAIAPVLTSQELSEAGYSTTVGIMPGEQPSFPLLPSKVKPVATGFWYGSRGDVVTCFGQAPKGQDSMQVLVLQPPTLGPYIFTSGGVMDMSAKILLRDERSGLAILRVGDGTPNAKFNRLKIATELPKSGEDIVRFGLKIETFKTSLGPVFARITNVDANIGGVSNFGSVILVYLPIPFRPLDCGAPVVNERGVVVAAVVGADKELSGSTIAVPTTYVKTLVEQADRTH